MTDKGEPWVYRLVRLAHELALSGTCPYGMEAADRGFEVFLQILFAKETEFRTESDAAVYHYISNGDWPKQSPWAGYITFLRVNCASEYACQLTAHDHSGLVLPFPKNEKADVIFTWFLIDHWERCFDVWLKLTAVSLFFTLPFYGLKPATE